MEFKDLFTYFGLVLAVIAPTTLYILLKRKVVKPQHLPWIFAFYGGGVLATGLTMNGLLNQNLREAPNYFVNAAATATCFGVVFLVGSWLWLKYSYNRHK